jgi:5-methylcytosine-specific restriction endonuclease McrA
VATAAQARAYYASLMPDEKAARRAKDRARPSSRRERKADQDAVRREVIDGLDGACACCRTDFYPHLTLDHVHGGGNAERQAHNCGGRKLVYVQVLCWNCNWTKHIHGRCPCSDEGGQ